MNTPRFTYRALIWLTASVLWMAVIYMKSAQSYQQQDLRPWLSDYLEASTLTAWLPHWSFVYDGSRITWREPYGFVEFFIRKGGHVGEYALLTFLWLRSLLAMRYALGRTLVLASLIAIGYAVTDEWHQTFVAGRTGHAIDVAVDACGVALVGVNYWLASRRSGKRA